MYSERTKAQSYCKMDIRYCGRMEKPHVDSDIASCCLFSWSARHRWATEIPPRAFAANLNLASHANAGDSPNEGDCVSVLPKNIFRTI
jgi:hypothetical protein